MHVTCCWMGKKLPSIRLTIRVTKRSRQSDDSDKMNHPNHSCVDDSHHFLQKLIDVIEGYLQTWYSIFHFFLFPRYTHPSVELSNLLRIGFL